MKLGRLLLLLFLVASALALFCGNAALAQEDTEVEVEKMDEKDAYAVLGLGKRATEAEIRKAFKDKSLVSLLYSPLSTRVLQHNIPQHSTAQQVWLLTHFR